jgi:hypothetical protein
MRISSSAGVLFTMAAAALLISSRSRRLARALLFRSGLVVRIANGDVCRGDAGRHCLFWRGLVAWVGCADLCGGVASVKPVYGVLVLTCLIPGGLVFP